jgi:hypothetical protein
MTTAQLWMHIVNIGFFFVATVIWWTVVLRIRRYPFISAYKRVGYLAAATALTLTTIFVMLQADWIWSGHNEAVGNLTSYAWLVFDYLLSVFMISLGMWSLANIEIIANACDDFLERPK